MNFVMKMNSLYLLGFIGCAVTFIDYDNGTGPKEVSQSVASEIGK